MSTKHFTDEIARLREENRELREEIRKYHDWAESKRTQIDHLRDIETRETMMRWELDSLRSRLLAIKAIIDGGREVRPDPKSFESRPSDPAIPAVVHYPLSQREPSDADAR